MHKMKCWEVLGIEPTGDIRLIKQAYASKLKVFHPEEDPDEFSKLQEAYRQALSQAETAAVREVYGEPVRQLSWQQARWADAPPSPREPAADRFMELLTSLCADAARRSDPGEWQRLLKGEEWPLSLAPELHDEVLRLLKEQLPLPYEAWTGCNELFAWIEPDKLDELFDNDELIAMLEYGGNWLSSRVRGDVPYEEALGDTREIIALWMAAFEQALDRQEERKIKPAAAVLKQRLDSLEQGYF